MPNDKEKQAFDAIYAACHVLGWEIAFDVDLTTNDPVTGLVIGSLEFIARHDCDLADPDNAREAMH